MSTGRRTLIAVWVGLAALLGGACTSGARVEGGAALLRFTRSWPAAGDAVECVVLGDRVILSAAAADVEGRVEIFRRSLASGEWEALRAAIARSGLLARGGGSVHPRPEAHPPLLHADGVVDAFQFPALARGAANAGRVRYHGVYDEAATGLMAELNRLLPEKIRLQPLEAR